MHHLPRAVGGQVGIRFFAAMTGIQISSSVVILVLLCIPVGMPGRYALLEEGQRSIQGRSHWEKLLESRADFCAEIRLVCGEMLFGCLQQLAVRQGCCGERWGTMEFEQPSVTAGQDRDTETALGSTQLLCAL